MHTFGNWSLTISLANAAFNVRKELWNVSSVCMLLLFLMK